MNEPTDDQLEILTLRGEILLQQQSIDWFANQQDYWRSLYFKDINDGDKWRAADE